jgi:hypothetical protein
MALASLFAEVRPTSQPDRDIYCIEALLESLILKNSIVFESVVHLLQIQSSVQCNTTYYNQNKILHDMIHMTIRIVLELVLVISNMGLTYAFVGLFF